MQQSNRKHKMLLRDSDADNVVAKPLDDTGHDARVANKKPAALHYNCLKTMGCFVQKDNGKHMTTSPSPLLLAKRQAPRPRSPTPPSDSDVASVVASAEGKENASPTTEAANTNIAAALQGIRAVRNVVQGSNTAGSISSGQSTFTLEDGVGGAPPTPSDDGDALDKGSVTRKRSLPSPQPLGTPNSSLIGDPVKMVGSPTPLLAHSAWLDYVEEIKKESIHKADGGAHAEAMASAADEAPKGGRGMPNHLLRMAGGVIAAFTVAAALLPRNKESGKDAGGREQGRG